mgnify:CR=1 FL=1
MKYDLIVIGSGPGGYVAAIRASQLGMTVAVVERAELGGICLNWGCIPTKSLLKSAQVLEYAHHAADYGVKIENATPDFDAIIARSRGVADKMSKGIQYLFKKNNITVIEGHGKLTADSRGNKCCRRKDHFRGSTYRFSHGRTFPSTTEYSSGWKTDYRLPSGLNS